MKEVDAHDFSTDNESWTAVRITDDDKFRFLDQGRDDPFKAGVSITAHGRHLKRCISVTLKGFERRGRIPISGFPATLAQIEERCRTSRRS